VKETNEQLAQADVVLDEDLNIYVAFNSSPRTKKALATLREKFYDVQCFKSDEQQPYSTFYHEGQRDVVGYILECIARVKRKEISDV